MTMFELKAGMAWPPKDITPLWESMRGWAAWWAGNPATSSARALADKHSKRMIDNGGLLGTTKAFFVGRPKSNPDRPSRPDIHLPVASDIARTSADLLYSDQPVFTSENEQANEAITTLIADGLLTVLSEGAEYGAALGGRYHRIVIDPAIREGRPFLTTISPEHVIPIFKWGTLTGAHIINEHPENMTIWRHIETHYLDESGNGHIRHQLFQGTTSSLGELKPLTDRPETAGLIVNAESEWIPSTGLTPGLMIAYIPNVTPQRTWRNHPQGRHLGRSDIQGLEPLMDALNETWSSWMRDIRLGKARILAAQHILETKGKGEGFEFDLDREVFTPLETLGPMDGGLPIQSVQFNIRVTEHAQTCQALLEQIINNAGYSLGSFQENTADNQVTATEVAAREKRTLITRDRKIVHETRGLQQLLTKMLSLMSVDSASLQISFSDAIQADPMAASGSLAALRSAMIMSQKVAIQYLHPDWDATQIDAEVKQISAESADTLVDPVSWRPQESGGEST